MWRRCLLLFGAIILTLNSLSPFARAADKTYRIGILSPSVGVVAGYDALLFPELGKLGFVKGQNLAVEVRTGRIDQLPSLAHELASTQVELVIAVGAAAIRAMKVEASTIPVVAAFIGEDPIIAGFAESLAHPRGEVTGILMLAPELDAKRLHILHEMLPAGRKIAALAVDRNRDAPNMAAVTEAANRAGIEIVPIYASTRDEYRAAFATMHIAAVDGVQILSAPELFADTALLASLAIDAKLPTICEWGSMAAQGCLIGYGPSYAELLRRVADYAARILRGAAPGSLPIEQPTRYEFIINLLTARAIDLTVPAAMLAHADELIE